MDREKQKEKARKRRNNKFRIREKARQYVKHAYGYNERDYSYNLRFYMRPEKAEPTREKEIERLIEREVQMAETRPRCSCDMCGNRRKHFDARTRQELKGTFDAEAQLEEAEISPASAKRVCRRIRSRKLSW